jgi:hypothetical protein
MTARRAAPLPGHPTRAGAGYDCCCGACLATPELRAGEWACRLCGDAFSGTPPEEDLCDWCATGAVWSDACAPGGYVCGHPAPGMPDGICGWPVESEPCPEHGPGENA